VRLALLAFSALLAIDQVTPQRDRPAPAAATGSIRGTVISSATGDPLHRVQLTLSGGTQSIRPSVTDTRGEFEFSNVPAGVYTITAKRLGYVSMQFGQRGNERGRPVSVGAGEVVRQINFSLVRGAVIAGTITDDTGTEFAGVRVDALEFRYQRGRRIPVTVATTATNDLGQFRLSGLSPGSYMIRASAIDTWMNDEGTAGYAFVPTYYPGVTAIKESETLGLAPSQELTSLNFAVRPGRTARIIGSYEASNLPLGAQSITLSRIGRTVGNAVEFSAAAGSARTDQNGAFEFRNLAPGEYTVSTGGDKDRGNVTVILSEGEERAVVIGPRQPTLVNGSVRIESGQPPRFALNRLRVVAIAADPDYIPPSTFGSLFSNVGGDAAFRYPDLVGAYLFRLEGLPDDWMLSAVTVNGNDLTDVPLDVGPGRPARGPLQITITNKAATLSGKVVGAGDRPSADATVLVFAADPSRWTTASRFIKVSRPRSDGQFTVSGLIPGRYLAVARASMAEGQWEDPLFLKSLVDVAAPIEVGIEERATIDLRLPRAQ
jgi:hypothetical protein